MGQRLEWKDVWFIELNYNGSDLQNDLISFFAIYSDFACFMLIGALFHTFLESSMCVFWDRVEIPVVTSFPSVLLLVILPLSGISLGLKWSGLFSVSQFYLVSALALTFTSNVNDKICHFTDIVYILGMSNLHIMFYQFIFMKLDSLFWVCWCRYCTHRKRLKVVAIDNFSRILFVRTFQRSLEHIM